MTFKRRKIAVLDLGTNTLLLLVGERDEEGKLTILADESEVPKLGEGLRATGRIAPHVLDRVATAVAKLTTKAREMGADEIHLVATSAAREAKNQDELLACLAKAANIETQILPPIEEARFTYHSVTAEMDGEPSCMVVDIGGGSTEITWGLGHRFDGGRSLDLGTIKLLEGHLRSDPPTPSEISAARSEIDTRLERVTPLGKLEHYFGTAGSFTHLAALDMRLTSYDSESISGYKLTHTRLKEWIDRLSRMPRTERLQLPGLDPRRVDVVFAGALIIERLFNKFSNPEFEIRDRGIRFGKLFATLRKFTPPITFAK